METTLEHPNVRAFPTRGTLAGESEETITETNSVQEGGDEEQTLDEEVRRLQADLLSQTQAITWLVGENRQLKESYKGIVRVLLDEIQPKFNLFSEQLSQLRQEGDVRGNQLNQLRQKVKKYKGDAFLTDDETDRTPSVGTVSEEVRLPSGLVIPNGILRPV